MQDLGWLRLNDIRELEEVLVSFLKGEKRLIVRGATQQYRYEGDSYRRGDARSRSEGRSEQDRSNRRERRDYGRRDRLDYDRRDRRYYSRPERREQDRLREDTAGDVCRCRGARLGCRPERPRT
ncbi:hypothetical protein PI124_g22032 [Phytophthora idaei]|nr:hypothetical protein PI125_g15779 [Phytophthora idaei]KAG3127190.1 hypothetical protein PI126_g21971 [Phytophthora idaei]KAG3232888.1 hypothetical protein PI124_g22032 [Phytophthora idaei]